MITPLRVALFIESYVEYGRGLLRGVAAYMHGHGLWAIYHQPWTSETTWPHLRRWRPSGIIAQLESGEVVRQVRKLGIPVVGLATDPLQAIPTLTTDNRAVARLAADHLIERGFKHLAYAGFAGVGFSEQRRKAFVDYLAEADHSAAVFEGPRIGSLFSGLANEAHNSVDPQAMAEWLKSLPHPLGLVACGDLYARQVLNACAEHDIAVPEEVAIIGAGDDRLLCTLCDPPLSSVELDPEGIGFQAAAILDQLMRGQQPLNQRVLVPPRGIVTRQSTDVLIGAEPDVVDAIRYLREGACRGARVKDVQRHAMLSHSTLQRRIRETLGRSPKAELVRVQLEQVKRLLATTDLPLLKISEQTGFTHLESMCRLFKKRVGRTPGQYRRESRT